MRSEGDSNSMSSMVSKELLPPDDPLLQQRWCDAVWRSSPHALVLVAERSGTRGKASTPPLQRQPPLILPGEVCSRRGPSGVGVIVLEHAWLRLREVSRVGAAGAQLDAPRSLGLILRSKPAPAEHTVAYELAEVLELCQRARPFQRWKSGCRWR